MQTTHSTNRHYEIDGIRGWAALMVLLFHVFWEVFGVVYEQFRHPALKFVMNGQLAVYIFFVLSGDALASQFIQTGERRALDKLVFKRYFRLAIPIFLSCVATYLVLLFGLNYNQAAAVIVRRQEWLGSFAPFDPNLATLIHYSFAGVFIDDSVARSYNPFLWPMQIELIGSFFLFAFLYATANSAIRPKITWVAFAIAFFVSPFYSLFFVGLMLCDFRHAGGFDAMHADKRWRYGSVLILGCCIAFVTISYIYTDMLKTQLIPQQAAQTVAASAPAKLSLFKLYGVRDKIYSLVAAAIVFAIYANAGLLGFFRNRLSRFLGRISFPLYLLHFSIIISLTSYLVVRYLNPAVDGLMVPLAIGLVSVCAALAAATAFEPVERYLLNILNKVVNRVIARGQAS